MRRCQVFASQGFLYIHRRPKYDEDQPQNTRQEEERRGKAPGLLGHIIRSSISSHRLLLFNVAAPSQIAGFVIIT